MVVTAGTSPKKAHNAESQGRIAIVSVLVGIQSRPHAFHGSCITGTDWAGVNRGPEVVEEFVMQPIEHQTTAQLLSALAGPKVAEPLLQRFGGLPGLARASVEELQQLQGIGPARAVAIRSAFQLAQRLSRETAPEAPMLDTPERVADLLREPNRLYSVEIFRWCA